jgi:hypothetical protein
MTAQQRTAIYAVAVALGPVLGAYGLVQESQWALILALVSTVLAAVTAFAHRPTKG